MKRCDFCAKAATVTLKKTVRVRSRGHLKMVVTIQGACAEHEQCPAWIGLLATQRDRHQLTGNAP